MKKITTIAVLTLLLASGMMTGCTNTPTVEQPNTLRVVSTIFPTYDWTQQILGDTDADLTLLLDQGVDLHNYQPTAEDLVQIANCDLFLYVGGESDAWVEKALENPVNPNRKVINLLDVLGDAVKSEEVIEGMEHEHDDHDTDDNHEDDHDTHDDHHEDEEETDEHVWLSLKNAEVLCKEITDQLSAIDPAHKDTYMKNLTTYTEKLDKLDRQYEEAVQNGSKRTVLFGDRFPFRYLVDDYGLDYYAAFSGCSTETEASFQTVTFLANKLDALDLSSVLTIEGRQHKVAQTIISNTNGKDQQILTLDSMQSTTAEDVKNGASYLSIMENNLHVLQDALK